MSRSYKKVAVSKDRGSRHTKRRFRCKTLANRSVRRARGVMNGGRYKRLFDSWDICDWRCYLTETQLKDDWEKGDEFLHGNFRTYAAAYRWWYTSYKRK